MEETRKAEPLADAPREPTEADHAELAARLAEMRQGKAGQ
jgi:hypothetical protein